MSRSIRAIATATLLFLGSSVTAAELNLPRNGWASWEVPAVANAPALCCFGWNDAPGAAPTCKLDEQQNGYGSRDHQTTDAMRVYARMRDGKPERVRALAANCPVQTDSPIQDLGRADENASVQSLAGLLQSREDKRSRDDLLAALAFHRASGAQDALIRVGTTGRDTHLRSQAWFWLAHTGANQTESAIDAALRNESEQHVREQAIFALSRLPEERATNALIKVAEDRSLSRELRKKAIFWLAQTGSDRATAYLDRIVTK